MGDGRAANTLELRAYKASNMPQACHIVKSAETGHGSRSTGHSFKSVERHIPWRCSRMDIIECESDEVHQQEHYGKVQIIVPAAGKNVATARK